MSVITFIKATICHSSSAAFERAIEDPKKMEFALKVISVKHQNALLDFNKARSDITKEIQIKDRIYKYERFLNALLLRTPQTAQKKTISDFNSPLTRLTVVSKNANDHQYFLPGDYQPKLLSITAAEERLI
ncbi:hypothetical protein [Erwinia mallotivora]|uniref:Uncharacterized protein n=1 Tax=Erwinia mallotivora TaxID=69222 RepID=A0A014MD35_9GAMM|nr:hypothetical protein [Erwinia mallotivora]EXU75979.1 hypothetical protein BG55_08445 [Erwinia mallotivora]